MTNEVPNNHSNDMKMIVRHSLTPEDAAAHMKMTHNFMMGMKTNGTPANVQQSHVRNIFAQHS